jgi:hypothetical protein
MYDFPHVSPEKKAEIESALMRGHSISSVLEALGQEEQKEIDKLAAEPATQPEVVETQQDTEEVQDTEPEQEPEVVTE